MRIERLRLALPKGTKADPVLHAHGLARDIAAALKGAAAPGGTVGSVGVRVEPGASSRGVAEQVAGAIGRAGKARGGGP